MSEENPIEEVPAWRRNAPLAVGIVVLAGLGFAAWQWLVPGAPPEVSKPPVEAPATLPPPPPEPAVANPLETPPDAPAAPTAADLEGALTELAGAGTVQSLFRLQDLPRRIVTTVDNLGRAQASASLWPVNPPTGEFTTDRSGETEVIASANYARYARHVAALEALEADAAGQAYRRLYPLLQRAYEDLGYPGKYFNDRLVAVIDLLLATPEPKGPIPVQLPEFGADMKPERPWVLYQYADPALEQLSAGQRILLRMGPDNQRRVKAKLRELRAEIATAPAA
jgi:hypothetical protein